MKHIKIFILLGLIILAILLILANNLLERTYSSQDSQMGVSYSPSYTQALGLDPQKTYLAILDDLKVKRLRIPAYWNEIEPYEGKFDFTKLDFYINEAKKHQASVILAIGYKLPRWPECRSPGWLNMDNDQARKDKELLMLKAVVKRYENEPTVTTWQLENEPLLAFGVCPPADWKFLKIELDLVKSLSQKPIMLTDSGELRVWITSMRLADQFGTTLYRVVYNDWLGNFYYPLRPWYYRTKGAIIKTLFAPQNQKIIISELQSEPWAKEFITMVPIAQQVKDFSMETFSENVSFAKKVGFDEIYLWGVEWWYYMKVNNHPEYWQYAKSIFNGQ